MPDDPLRVLLTGDQPVVRTALARLIAAEPGMDVVGECPNRHEELAEAMSANPDVVVMDLDLGSRVTAPETVAELLGATRCPTLILTGTDDPRGLASALGHGALGVVLKNRPAEVLMRAIRAVRAGEAWLEQSTVANAFRVAPPDRGGNEHDREQLTRREAEVVAMVSMGLPNKKIAELLFISETTVRHHLTSIYSKLSVANRLELMRYIYGAKRG
jgi:two-component system, NarL family, nitrate/nitrite response regulator NarL